MKILVFGIAACISSAALAHPAEKAAPASADRSVAKEAPVSREEREARIALEEKMAQRQMGLLLARFAEQDVQASGDTRRYSADALSLR